MVQNRTWYQAEHFVEVYFSRDPFSSQLHLSHEWLDYLFESWTKFEDINMILGTVETYKLASSFKITSYVKITAACTSAVPDILYSMSW